MAFIAIANVVSSGLNAAETAQSYGHNLREGNGDYADLDAIALAIEVGDATGNYFMAHEVLDILLQ